MDKPVGSKGRGRIRLQGRILVARTFCFAIALVLLCPSVSFGLVFWALVISGATLFASLKNRRDLLPYCFLAASTMWAGAAVSIALAGGDGITVLLALCLSAVDSGLFVSSGCGGIRR